MANVAYMTATARSQISYSWLSHAPGTEPKYIGWGTGVGQGSSGTPGPPVAADIALYLEDTTPGRTNGTGSQVTTTTTDDTFQVTGTIVAGSDNPSITEVALFDGSAAAAQTTWATAPSTTSGTTGTLTSGTGFTSGCYAQDQSGEVMLFGTVSGASVSVITRGANGSTAETSANGHQITVGGAPGAANANLASAGGNMLLHGMFPAVSLTSGESIAFTVGLKFT